MIDTIDTAIIMHSKIHWRFYSVGELLLFWYRAHDSLEQVCVCNSVCGRQFPFLLILTILSIAIRCSHCFISFHEKESLMYNLHITFKEYFTNCRNEQFVVWLKSLTHHRYAMCFMFIFLTVYHKLLQDCELTVCYQKHLILGQTRMSVA